MFWFGFRNISENSEYIKLHQNEILGMNKIQSTKNTMANTTESIIPKLLITFYLFLIVLNSVMLMNGSDYTLLNAGAIVALVGGLWFIK